MYQVIGPTALEYFTETGFCLVETAAALNQMATAYTTVDGDNAGQMRQVEDILIVHRMQDQLDQLRTGTAPSSGTTPAEPAVGAAEALDGAGTGRSYRRTGERAAHRPVGAVHPCRHTRHRDHGSDQRRPGRDAGRDDRVTTHPTIAGPDDPHAERDLSDSLRAMDEATEGIHQSMATIQRISELHRRPR